MSYRFTLIFALTLLATTGAVLLPDTVFAQGAPGSGGGTFSDPTKVFGPVMGAIMSLFAYIMGVAGILLNQVMHYTVVHMGDYIHGLAAIEVAWRVLRDLGNIVLIFGFLAIGIATIIDARIYGGGTKMLPILLIAAVLLNFSLFIAEAVIDVGNLFATQVYTQINGGTLSSAPSPGNEGISNTIMQNIGLQTFYNINGQQPAGWNATTMITGLLGILLFLIAAFVMFSLSFMLVSRFVILILLIIVSPLGFAGLAVPKLTGLAHQWWDMLFKQTLTAPVLLLSLYIALKVITDDCFLGSSGTGGGITCTGLGTTQTGAQTAYTNVINGTSGDITVFAGVLLSFLVAMGLLLACVVIAKQMSAFGASWATKWGGALSFGLTGFALRNTAGWGLTAGARAFRKTPLARIPVAGRAFANLLDRGGKSSFDFRGTKALKNLPFGGGIDAGDAQKGGFAGGEEKRLKARETYGKSLKQSSGDKRREADAKTEKATREAEHKRDMSALEARQRAERQPLDDEAREARRRLAEARASGDKAAITREETSVNNALRNLEELRKKQADLRTEQENAHKEIVAGLDSQIKQAQNAPQISYAKGLRLWMKEDSTFNKWINLYSITEAANRIEAFTKKSKTDRDNEAMLATLKTVADKVGSGGGGGGGGAAPAAGGGH